MACNLWLRSVVLVWLHGLIEYRSRISCHMLEMMVSCMLSNLHFARGYQMYASTIAKSKFRSETSNALRRFWSSTFCLSRTKISIELMA